MANRDDQYRELRDELAGASRRPLPARSGSGRVSYSSSDVLEALEAESKQRKRKRGFWKVVFVIALVVFVVSAAALGVLAYSYYQGQQKYDSISEIADLGDLAGLASDDGDANHVNVDWEALLAHNPDTVGWLYVPNTVISYPIVKGEDNEFYLTHDFDGDEGWLANYGAIFMDHENSADWQDSSYFIYGHHMRDGSMFADFVGLEDQARFDECRTIYILSPKGNFKLRTFSIVHCAPDDAIVMTEFDSAKQMATYVQDKMDRSLVKVDDAPPADEIGKLFAFATCDNASWGRYVVFAYVEDASDEGLKGKVGIKTKDGEASGFVDKIKKDD